MSEHEEKNSEKQSGAGTRTAIIATVGIALILGLALFIGFWVVPVLQTRAVVREFSRRRGQAPPAPSAWNPAALALEKLGGRKRAVTRLSSYLRLPDWIAPYKVAATDLLGSCGPRAVSPLIEALGSTNSTVRTQAAWSLSALGPAAEEAVPILIERLLNDERASVRLGAAEALGNTGPEAKTAAPALRAALGDEDGDVRWAALVALGKLGVSEPED